MLWVSFLLFLVLIGVMVVTLRLGVVRLGRSLGEATARRHRAAEHILDTGCVPEEWRSDSPLSGVPRAEDARQYLRRLDRLTRYFRRAPVFDAESTRSALLDGLAEARARWSGGLWERSGGPTEDGGAQPGPLDEARNQER